MRVLRHIPVVSSFRASLMLHLLGSNGVVRANQTLLISPFRLFSKN